MRTPPVHVQLLDICVTLELLTPLGHSVGASVAAVVHVELHHPLYPTESFVGQGRPGAVMGTVEVELCAEIRVELMLGYKSSAPGEFMLVAIVRFSWCTALGVSP